MEIKQLKAFLAVADAKSFLKAADNMYISRQALSKTIKLLEEELQLELFERSQGGAVLTPAGLFLYPRAQTLVAESDKLKADIMDVHRSYKQTVKIYMAQGIYGQYASNLMSYGAKYSASIDLHMFTCLDSDCETILADRKADIVLSYSLLSSNIALTSKLFNSPLMFMINEDNPLLEKPKLTTKDIMGESLLLYTDGNGKCLWWFDHPRDNDICCTDLNYIFTLLKEDAGILPIPSIAIPPFLDYAEGVPAPTLVAPIPIYYSTLHPENYTRMEYNLLEDLRNTVFKQYRF